MERTKKRLTGQTIAIIVLSILLAVSTITCGTMAWFSDKATASGTATFGVVDINGDTTLTLEFTSSTLSEGATGKVVPGTKLQIKSIKNNSNVSVYVRYQLSLGDAGDIFDTPAVGGDYASKDFGTSDVWVVKKTPLAATKDITFPEISVKDSVTSITGESTNITLKVQIVQAANNGTTWENAEFPKFA